jgi:hypothetical protein
MIDMEAIHQGFANATNGFAVTIGSLTVQLRSYPSLPGAINPPVLAPVEFSMDYHQTFGANGGLMAATFSLGLFTSLGDTDAGRKMMNAFLNPSAILTSLETDKTLGGASKTLVVNKVHGAYRLYTIGGAEYLGAMIDVKVWA